MVSPDPNSGIAKRQACQGASRGNQGGDKLVAERKQSSGTCTYCGAVVAISGVTKHMAACSEHQAAIENAHPGKGGPETLYHLRARDASQGEYWLDLEMPGSGTLRQLDDYLRAIWLECCGHLSEFSIGAWRGDRIPMSKKIGQVFLPGVQLTHIYDFGTSSETLIKVIGTREGRATTKRPVALMARNVMPEAQCRECERPATWLCMECLIEEDEWGVFCDEHAETHPHEDYGEPVRLVNSPRLGMCGYDGPAEPPY